LCGGLSADLSFCFFLVKQKEERKNKKHLYFSTEKENI